ncbi:MAG: hypothetical protein HYW78_01440 [Parcubacteria group bacterium]|nr:hypothetical protein [Parcubacteria group bacterium]
MTKNTKIILMGAFDFAFLTAIFLSIFAFFMPIPSQTIPFIGITISRWWDILFAGISAIFITSFALYLYRSLDEDRNDSMLFTFASIMYSALVGMLFTLATFDLWHTVPIVLRWLIASSLVLGIACGFRFEKKKILQTLAGGIFFIALFYTLFIGIKTGFAVSLSHILFASFVYCACVIIMGAGFQPLASLHKKFFNRRDNNGNE